MGTRLRGHQYAKESKAKLVDQQPVARTSMQKPPLNPDVSDTAPFDPVLTRLRREAPHHVSAPARRGCGRRVDAGLSLAGVRSPALRPANTHSRRDAADGADLALARSWLGFS